jgi:hypothetical protein
MEVSWSLPAQTVRFGAFGPAVQTPLWQVSFSVQALPSSQPVPFVTASQSPVAGLQVWHWGQPVAQVQGPQSTDLPQLLSTVAHLPTQVVA